MAISKTKLEDHLTRKMKHVDELGCSFIEMYPFLQKTKYTCKINEKKEKSSNMIFFPPSHVYTIFSQNESVFRLICNLISKFRKPILHYIICCSRVSTVLQQRVV